jgi:hypothetical protein
MALAISPKLYSGCKALICARFAMEKKMKADLKLLTLGPLELSVSLVVFVAIVIVGFFTT